MVSALPHHCGKCTSRWNGLKTAHCTACHRTFTGIEAADAHRDGSHTGTRKCLPPDKVGLVLTDRLYPCWGFPGDTASDDETPQRGLL